MGKVRLLLLEDVPTDAELIKLVLKRSGIDFLAIVASNKVEFIKALDEQEFDAILADNSLPQFSATEALEIINKRKITIPFILVTGSISEEYAVKMMKQGATDYILKDRLQRLPSALQGALDKCQLETEKKKYLDEVIANESLLREAAMLAHFGSWETDILNGVERWSDEQYRIFGYAPGEVSPSIENFFTMVYPDDRVVVKKILDEAISNGERKKFNCRIVTKEGEIKHIHSEMVATTDNIGTLHKLNGFIMDVSETIDAEQKEKKITADLVQKNKDLEQFAYIISHNLRGPVANIVGLTEVLTDDNVEEDEKGVFMDALSTSIKKLDNVIIDLNNIIQVKNHVNENKQKVELFQIVEDIKSDLTRAIRENNAEICCEFEVKEMLTLKSYLHSIFYNLIANSIKFRRPGITPVIEVSSRVRGDKVELTFKDNCIGIDLNRRSKHMFGLYKRFHPDHAEGKGMGLYMVKSQVEALGGKINVESVVNEGTTFMIEFDLQNFVR